MIFSRAPVRICDVGGWTDTWFYPNGAVFNICVDLYSSVRIKPKSSDKIKIFSENLNLCTEIKDFNNIEYDGNLDLLKAAIKRMNIRRGLEIYVRTQAPPGCGTGTSASVAVSLISALAELSNKAMSPHEIAKLAHNLETEELMLESGVQDQYAAAYGGINFMDVNYPLVKMTPIKIRKNNIFKLESQLILVYLGSRSSSEMHKAVIDNFKKGDKLTLKSFETIKNCAFEMKKAIKSEDLSYVGALMDMNWNAQKKLHRLMVNPLINKVEDIAMKNGAIGFKVNGAGG
ncbi:MAG: GHMP family kinase ATP-binding protein, partial [Promethearchaeota archaeon]